MTVKVKLFASIRDIVGSEERELLLPNKANGLSVIDTLAAEYPKIHDWKRSLRIAVNREYVPFEHELHDQDEVALIPPVSGG